MALCLKHKEAMGQQWLKQIESLYLKRKQLLGTKTATGPPK